MKAFISLLIITKRPDVTSLNEVITTDLLVSAAIIGMVAFLHFKPPFKIKRNTSEIQSR